MIYKTKFRAGVVPVLGIFAAFVALLILAGCQSSPKPSAQQQPAQTANGFAQVNTVDNGAALQGYDAVAYFTENKPVRGKPEFSHNYPPRGLK